MKEDLNDLPASRDEAIDEGEIFYYTGLPCRHGHMAKRYTSSGQCLECQRSIHKAKADRLKENRKRRLADKRRELASAQA